MLQHFIWIKLISAPLSSPVDAPAVAVEVIVVNLFN